MRSLISMGMVLITCAALPAGVAQQTEANVVIEIPFWAENAYVNPFMDVTLDVIFTDPDGKQKTVPAFWAGNNRRVTRNGGSMKTILTAARWVSRCRGMPLRGRTTARQHAARTAA